MAHAELKHARQLDKKLKGFGDKIYRRWMRRAIVAGSRPIISATRAKAPKRTGALAKSISRKVKSYRRSLSVIGIVGPRTDFMAARVGGTVTFLKGRRTRQFKVGKGGRIRPSNYAHLVEGGTRARRIKNWLGRKGVSKWVSRMPAQPFLKPAFQATHRAAITAIVKELRTGIAKEARSRG